MYVYKHVNQFDINYEVKHIKKISLIQIMKVKLEIIIYR